MTPEQEQDYHEFRVELAELAGYKREAFGEQWFLYHFLPHKYNSDCFAVLRRPSSGAARDCADRHRLSETGAKS